MLDPSLGLTVFFFGLRPAGGSGRAIRRTSISAVQPKQMQGRARGQGGDRVAVLGSRRGSAPEAEALELRSLPTIPQTPSRAEGEGTDGCVGSWVLFACCCACGASACRIPPLTPSPVLFCHPTLHCATARSCSLFVPTAFDRPHSIHADGRTRNAGAIRWSCFSCGGWRWRGFC